MTNLSPYSQPPLNSPLSPRTPALRSVREPDPVHLVLPAVRHECRRKKGSGPRVPPSSLCLSQGSIPADCAGSLAEAGLAAHRTNRGRRNGTSLRDKVRCLLPTRSPVLAQRSAVEASGMDPCDKHRDDGSAEAPKKLIQPSATAPTLPAIPFAEPRV